MTPIENLYYSLGQMAYAIAKADGFIQKEERELFHNILRSEFENHESDLDYTEIIFKLLENDHQDLETAYNWAINGIKLNSQYVSEELKNKFIAVIDGVSAAFPPKTKIEQRIIDRFKNDLRGIKGDPVFSGRST